MFASIGVFSQDKLGFGNDTEGADSAGVGMVTTWVKPDQCCHFCQNSYINYKYHTECGDYSFNDLASSKIAIDARRSCGIIYVASRASRLIDFNNIEINRYLYKPTTVSPYDSCSFFKTLTHWGEIKFSDVIGESVIIHMTLEKIDYVEYY